MKFKCNSAEEHIQLTKCESEYSVGYEAVLVYYTIECGEKYTGS